MLKRLINFMACFAELALACRTTPLEMFWRGLQRGPFITRIQSGPGQFAGFAVLNSGNASVTVSTTMVRSGDLILHGFNVATTVASGSGGCATCVSSIVDGVSMAFGYTDGVARGPGGTFMFEIKRTR